mmetsp:Transcript_18809/g.31687  ORF Transcript_18809/g.31687 Transcript_18809/m.31687 type:complete len:80 (+) Transcript_18809:362-601(+)
MVDVAMETKAKKNNNSTDGNQGEAQVASQTGETGFAFEGHLITTMTMFPQLTMMQVLKKAFGSDVKPSLQLMNFVIKCP